MINIIMERTLQIRYYNVDTLENGAITFAHIFLKFRLRTVFICAQKCLSFAHSFSVTFARMFLHIFLGHLLVFY